MGIKLLNTDATDDAILLRLPNHEPLDADDVAEAGAVGGSGSCTRLGADAVLDVDVVARAGAAAEEAAGALGTVAPETAMRMLAAAS